MTLRHHTLGTIKLVDGVNGKYFDWTDILPLKQNCLLVRDYFLLLTEAEHFSHFHSNYTEETLKINHISIH